MTTLEQVKTYVQNHLVAVVATSVLALVSVSTIATTGYQTFVGKSETGFLRYFNMRNYIKNIFGDNSEEEEEEPVKVKIKGNENQMQQPPVDEAKDQH